jgi:hypothetical protein
MKDGPSRGFWGAGVVTEEEVTGGKLEKQVERISIAFYPVI